MRTSKNSNESNFHIFSERKCVFKTRNTQIFMWKFVEFVFFIIHRFPVGAFKHFNVFMKFVQCIFTINSWFIFVLLLILLKTIRNKNENILWITCNCSENERKKSFYIIWTTTINMTNDVYRALYIHRHSIKL